DVRHRRHARRAAADRARTDPREGRARRDDVSFEQRRCDYGAGEDAALVQGSLDRHHRVLRDQPRALGGRVNRLTRVIVLALLAWARPSAAQQAEPPRFFLDGAALAAIERRGHSDAFDLSAIVPGGAVGVGTFLTSDVSLRMEVAFPAGTSAASTSSIPPLIDLPIDLPIGSLIAISSINSATTSLRSVSTMVLAAYHMKPAGRLRVAYLGGVSFERLRTNLVTTTTSAGLPPLIPTRVVRVDTTTIGYNTAIALGMDAAVELATHVALVPQVRVVAFGGFIGIRPGVAVRWTP